MRTHRSRPSRYGTWDGSRTRPSRWTPRRGSSTRRRTTNRRSGFYRFRPHTPGVLRDGGVLEMLAVRGGAAGGSPHPPAAGRVARGRVGADREPRPPRSRAQRDHGVDGGVRGRRGTVLPARGLLARGQEHLLPRDERGRRPAGPGLAVRTGRRSARARLRVAVGGCALRSGQHHGGVPAAGSSSARTTPARHTYTG